MTGRFRAALLAAVALTAVCGAYARGIAFDSGVRDYLPDNVPAVKAWLGSLQRFDAFDSWLVGLEEPGPSLSLEGLRHVDRVTRALEGLKAAGVLSVRSVTNVQSLREGSDGSVDSGPLIPALPSDASALDALAQLIRGDRQVLGALVSRDLKGYALLVRADPRKDAVAVAELVERTVEAERGPLAAHYLGAPFFAAAPLQRLAAGLPWIAPLFLLLLLGIFIGGTRRPGAAIAVLATAGMSLIWGLALLRYLGRSLSPSAGNAALVLFAVAGALFANALEPSARPPLARRPGFPSAGRVALCLLALGLAGALAFHARVLCTPQDMFGAHDEVGRSLAFFDERFGGSDFIQLDFRGDLQDSAVAARLFRLTDLLEGSGNFADVRSVAQILAFLNHGFGDGFRIPGSRAALANVWFFLEGNGDVRNLVSDARDEALVVVHVPSRPKQGIDTLVASVNAAVARSAEQGATAGAERIEAIARASEVRLDPGRVAAVTASATGSQSPTDETAVETLVAARLRGILASPDSPYQPSNEEWDRLAAALNAGPGDLRSRLTAAVATMERLTASGMGAKLVDTLVDRERDLRVEARSEQLAARLWEGGAGVPESFRLRAEGALADLLDPQVDGGRATVTVGGMPVVAGAIAANAREVLWRRLAWIFGLGAALSLLFGVRTATRGLLVASTATALTFLGCRAAGLEIDTGSAAVYVLPALLGFVAADGRRAPQSFLIALGTATLTLLFTGSLPVTRVAAATALGLWSVALVAWFLRDRAPPT